MILLYAGCGVWDRKCMSITRNGTRKHQQLYGFWFDTVMRYTWKKQHLMTWCHIRPNWSIRYWRWGRGRTQTIDSRNFMRIKFGDSYTYSWIHKKNADATVAVLALYTKHMTVWMKANEVDFISFSSFIEDISQSRIYLSSLWATAHFGSYCVI